MSKVRVRFDSCWITWVSDGARGLIGAAPGGLITIRRDTFGWSAFQNGVEVAHGLHRHEALYRAADAAYKAAGATTYAAQETLARSLRLGPFYGETA